ncbi:hypothetical protein V8E53_005368 [Lactarius tabidus]
MSCPPAPGSELKKLEDGFKMEVFDAAHQFWHIKDQNGGVLPALHPTLVVLFIVFYKHDNLAEIFRDFPDVRKHMEYNPDAKFPKDITNLLPPVRSIGGKCLAQQRQEVPCVSVTLPKVQLILPAQPKESAESPEVVIEEMDNEVDKLEDDNYIQPSESMCTSTSRSASNSAAKTKKWKGTLFLEPTAMKQHTGPLQQQALSTLHPEPSGPSAGRAGYKFECEQCIKADADCKPDPVGPCWCCVGKKLGCSLMMPNEARGKTARGKLNPEVYEMCKGKQPACGPGKLIALTHKVLRHPWYPSIFRSPPPPKMFHLSAATAATAAVPAPAAAAPAPATCSHAHAPACPPAGTSFCAPAHAPDHAPNTTTVHAPIPPPALPAPSASGAPTTAHVSPAAAVASSAAASPVTADSPGADICSSPSAGSPVLTHTTPALALVLGRFVVPQQHEVLTLPSPSHQQQVDTDTMLGRVPGDPLADMIRGIEIRLDAIEEWMCRDAKWKC